MKLRNYFTYSARGLTDCIFYGVVEKIWEFGIEIRILDICVAPVYIQITTENGTC